MSKEKSTPVAAQVAPEVVVVEVPKTAAEQIAEMRQAMEDAKLAMVMKKAELAEQMAELKNKALELKIEAAAAAEEMKTAQAEERAAKLREAMEAKGLVAKVNKTQIIKEHLLAGRTIDEIVELEGYSRKEISDRTWQIEKALGLR